MNTQEKIEKVIDIAKEEYDGHFTLMRFTTNWRFIFGTLGNDEEIFLMESAKTLDEILDKAIKNKKSVYDFD